MSTEGSKARPEAEDFSHTEVVNPDSTPHVIESPGLRHRAVDVSEKKLDSPMKIDGYKSPHASEKLPLQKAVESNSSVLQASQQIAAQKDESFISSTAKTGTEQVVSMKRVEPPSPEHKKTATRSLSADIARMERPEALNLITSHNRNMMAMEGAYNSPMLNFHLFLCFLGDLSQSTVSFSPSFRLLFRARSCSCHLCLLDFI